jgi:hypothetical protein
LYSLLPILQASAHKYVTTLQQIHVPPCISVKIIIYIVYTKLGQVKRMKERTMSIHNSVLSSSMSRMFTLLKRY